MAKFEKIPVTPQYEYHLTLTEEEIRVLLTIFNRIGGAPEGYRGVLDKVKYALLESKLTELGTSVLQEKSNHLSQTIYFRNTK